jgi:hypothetical protein
VLIENLLQFLRGTEAVEIDGPCLLVARRQESGFARISGMAERSCYGGRHGRRVGSLWRTIYLVGLRTAEGTAKVQVQLVGRTTSSMIEDSPHQATRRTSVLGRLGRAHLTGSRHLSSLQRAFVRWTLVSMHDRVTGEFTAAEESRLLHQSPTLLLEIPFLR